MNHFGNITAILKNANLEKTSSKNVRLSLESTFSCNFSNRRKEIDQMVMDYVDSLQNDEDSECGEEEEEVEKKKLPPKKAAKKRKANSDSDASSDNKDSGDDYKPKKPAPKPKKAKKADAGTTKKGTARKSILNVTFRTQSNTYTVRTKKQKNETKYSIHSDSGHD